MNARPKQAGIDVEAIVRDRLGSKARFVPRFVLSWLKGFIHQDFINAYLRQERRGVDFCSGAMTYLDVSIEVEGVENLPREGKPCIFVCNHPLGAIDGIALGSVLGGHYGGNIMFLVNDLLMHLPGLAPLCAPVNKIGRQSRQSMQRVVEAFRSDRHVILFPAGLCSRQRADGEICDLSWSKTFVKLSREYGRDVVPLHFLGRNSQRFYTVARWCERLHLPNFAMLLLPDEMFRARGGHYCVRIGKPIAWQHFDTSKSPAAWAQYVKEIVYEL